MRKVRCYCGEHHTLHNPVVGVCCIGIMIRPKLHDQPLNDHHRSDSEGDACRSSSTCQLAACTDLLTADIQPLRSTHCSTKA